MIPGPLFTLPMLLLLLAPWLAVAITLCLLLSGLSWWLRHRRIPSPQRPPFWRWPSITLAVLAAAGNLWGVVLLYEFDLADKQFALQQHYRESRRNFVLPQAFQHGELLVPQGSLVNLYDPFDNGEAQRPLSLRGLDTVQFPTPIQVAGVWTTVLDASSGYIQLDRDQRIGPAVYFDGKANDGYGDWVPEPKRPYLECKKGQIAKFKVPLIDYDIVAEFGHPEPDGPQARFRPSQWRVMSCESDRPIEIKPPYNQAGPKGAQTPVWGPLPPNTN